MSAAALLARRTGRIGTLLMAAAWVVLAGSGCATLQHGIVEGWGADFDTAEKRMRKSDRDMLIWYRSVHRGRPDPLQAPLKERNVRKASREFVRCMLFKSYEPDRRYVAQFGVERAPALIVVRSDGTYHAQTGAMTTAQVERFLSDAAEPGQAPRINPLVPRRVEYEWRSLKSAQRFAEDTGRPILVVYYRQFSRDWSEIEGMIERPEVFARWRGMAHARVGSWNPWAKARRTPYGELRLPALVLVYADGTHHVLEMPGSYETIVRFADRCEGGTATAELSADSVPRSESASPN